MPKAARGASGTVGDLKPRGLAGNARSAVPYSAPRTSARHTRDAAGRRRPPDPGFRRVQRHRNDGRLRDMQRERDRAKHRAANTPMIASFFMRFSHHSKMRHRFGLARREVSRSTDATSFPPPLSKGPGLLAHALRVVCIAQLAH